jgi:hypothetical protein
VLSSTNGDLLADEVVDDRPNPPLAAPTDIEVVEETKYVDLTIAFSLKIKLLLIYIYYHRRDICAIT